MDKAEIIRGISDRYSQHASSMNERQRRLWCAEEAMKLGRGGIALVCKALHVSPNTIKKGMQEIASGQEDLPAGSESRIRKKGGGRKLEQP